MKKCSSLVWQFFDRLEENDRCVAVLCKLCDCEYKYFGNTTNLRAHLMKKHPIQWDLRTTNEDAQKSEETIRFYSNNESTASSRVSPKRRKVSKPQKDKNVRYSLSIKATDNKMTGEDSMPEIEIQRVDVLQNQDNDDDEEGDTSQLIKQLHNNVSDEEWLEENYQQVDMYDNKQKRIKREVMSPSTIRPSSYITHNSVKPDQRNYIVPDDSPNKDEFSIFGEYIANKLRKFKAPRTQGNIQQMITTILWQAEYGVYDDADAVKRVLMCPLPPASDQTIEAEGNNDSEH